MDFFNLFLELFKNLKPIITSDAKTSIVSKNIYGEFVRKLDVEVDSTVREFLRSNKFNGIIISEESISKFGEGGCIYLDPVDGSLNYSRGLKQYGFLIAYSSNCNIWDINIGLVWVADGNEIIVGDRGKGVFQITDFFQKRITKIPVKNDLDIVLEVGDMVGEKLSWLKKIGSLRHFGSMAYSFKLFIKGVIDGIIDFSGKLKFTDVAAFIPILEHLRIPYKLQVLEKINMYNPKVGFLVANSSDLFEKILRLLN